MSSRKTKKPSTTPDTVALYMASGCSIHPLLYNEYLDQLEQLDKKGKICLLPSTIFTIYHRKIRKRHQSEQIA